MLGFAVVWAFDEFVSDGFAFDDAGVAAVTAVAVGAGLDFVKCFADGVGESVRGKNPPGW